MIWLLLLLLPLSCWGQQNSFADLAFMEPPAVATSPCTAGTNNVQWTPTNSIVTWQGVVGSGTGQYQYQFNTNPICDILAVQLNDVINTATNVNTLTNMRAFECIASDGSTNRSMDLSNLYRMTNAQVSYFTNMHYVDITGCSNLVAGNFSQNPLMTNLVGWADSTNWDLASGLTVYTCGFSRMAQSNMMWTATNLTVTAGMSGWRLDISVQHLSSFTETLDAATTANIDYGCVFFASDMNAVTIDPGNQDLLNAKWTIQKIGPDGILCNTNTSTVYIEYSPDDSTYTPKRNLAWPGYGVQVDEDMTGMPNPCYLKFYVYDSEVNRNSGDSGGKLYSDPPP